MGMDLWRVTFFRHVSAGKCLRSRASVLGLGAAIAIQALVALPSPSFAQPEKQHLVFVGNGNIPPLIDMPDGQPQGLVVDLVLAMAARAGLDATFVGMDWTEAQRMVQRGEADALVQINPTTERETQYDFSRPLLESQFSIFRKDLRADINSLGSLFGRTVGVERNGYPMQILARYPQIRTRIIPSWKTGFELLNANEIDAVVVDRWVGEYELARNAMRGITVVDNPIETSQSAIAVRKGNDVLLAGINAGLGKINADGTAARIRNRWRSREVVYVLREDVNFWTFIAALGAASSCFLAIFISYSVRLRRANTSLNREVADRKSAQQALLESEQRYMALATGTFEGVVLSDQGVIVDVNPQFSQISGWPADQLIRRAIANFLPPGMAPKILANIHQELEARVEHELICADGSLRIVEAHGRPHLIGDKKLRLTALRDITEYRKAETSLRASEERFRVALSGSPVVVFEQDLDLNYAWIHNPKLGYSASDIIGKTDADLVEAGCAEELTRFKRDVIASGRPGRREFGVAAPGRPTEYFDLYAEPHRDAAGRIIGVICAAADVTQRKAMEADLLRAKAEAEREALARSKFLAAASHDLRQPVQALMLIMAAIKSQEISPSMRKALTLMEGALDGLSGLLSSILDVSRLDSGVVMPQLCDFDVGALLGRLASEYSVLAGNRGLRIRAMTRTVILRTDPALLERALRNLIENALRYTPTGGVLLGVRVRRGGGRVEVVDSGIGISPENLPHIFEEFYQVGNPGRDRAQGLGLGLAVVARLMRLMGTRITVASREGHGTRFSLDLPLGTSAPIPSAGWESLADTPKIRVLIVEDDPSVRSGLELLVESWGHSAVVAATGEEAQELCPAARGEPPIDIILADYRLGPGISGTQAAVRIRARIGRSIPVVMITGDTEPGRIAEIHASGFTLLHKPVDPEDLRRTLARLVRGAATAGAERADNAD